MLGTWRFITFFYRYVKLSVMSGCVLQRLRVITGDYDTHSVSLWRNESWSSVRDLIGRADELINGNADGKAGVRGGEVGLQFKVPADTRLNDLTLVPVEGIGAPCARVRVHTCVFMCS